MRDSAGSCASIRALRFPPLRESALASNLPAVVMLDVCRDRPIVEKLTAFATSRIASRPS
jgi:hypothetical protein